jgi:excisionase family DNA binding protein
VCQSGDIGHMTDPRPHLRALAEALPLGSAVTVPREWLLELLDAGGAAAVQTSANPAIAPADMTVHQVADRFGRHRSTIRMWLEQGSFPGAYRFRGREWRIPAAGLAAFERAQRDAGKRGQDRADSNDVAPHAPRSASAPVDLSSWRNVVLRTHQERSSP